MRRLKWLQITFPRRTKAPHKSSLCWIRQNHLFVRIEMRLNNSKWTRMEMKTIANRFSQVWNCGDCKNYLQIMICAFQTDGIKWKREWIYAINGLPVFFGFLFNGTNFCWPCLHRYHWIWMVQSMSSATFLFVTTSICHLMCKFVENFVYVNVWTHDLGSLLNFVERKFMPSWKSFTWSHSMWTRRQKV